jgi:hypothetical protein
MGRIAAVGAGALGLDAPIGVVDYARRRAATIKQG